MQRRRYLALTAAGLSALAGCGNTGTPSTRTTTSTTSATAANLTTTTTTTTTERTTTETTTDRTTTEATTEETTTTDPGPTDEELASEDIANADQYFGTAVETYIEWSGNPHLPITWVTIANENINPTDVVRIIRKAGKDLDAAAEHNALHDEIQARRKLNRWIQAAARAQKALATHAHRFDVIVEVAYAGNATAVGDEGDDIRAAAREAANHRKIMQEGAPDDATVTEHLSADDHRSKTAQVNNEIEGAHQFVAACNSLLDGVDVFETAANQFNSRRNGWGDDEFDDASDVFGTIADEFDGLPDSEAVRDAAKEPQAASRALAAACESFHRAALYYQDGSDAVGRSYFDDGHETVEDQAGAFLDNVRSYPTPPPKSR